MFERFTERARFAVISAQECATELHHDQIGSVHLVVGILRQPESLGHTVLKELGVSEETCIAAARALYHSNIERRVGQLPFTTGCKRVLELSLREALSLGHNYIGTEHMVLALVRNGEPAIDAVASAEDVRNAIIRKLSGPGRRQQEESAPPLPVIGTVAITVSLHTPIEFGFATGAAILSATPDEDVTNEQIEAALEEALSGIREAIAEDPRHRPLPE